MHDDQIDLDADTVRRLLTEQSPEFAELPIEPLASTGTVNALFRLGDGLVARLPIVERWADGIEREWRWLPWLSERVSSIRLPERCSRDDRTTRTRSCGRSTGGSRARRTTPG
jgi:aminoglycoside phosphotransferase (APT) family kinase protein